MSIFNATTNEMTTAKAPTLAGITALMDDFRRRFPPADMPKAVRCSGQMLAELRMQVVTGESCGFQPYDMYGLPVCVDPSLRYPVYVVEMQDGTEVVYPRREGHEAPIRRKTWHPVCYEYMPRGLGK